MSTRSPGEGLGIGQNGHGSNLLTTTDEQLSGSSFSTRSAGSSKPVAQSQAELLQEIRELSSKIAQIQEGLDPVIVGMQKERRFMVISAMIGKHMLLEGEPGLAKTLLCSSFAKVLGLNFQRIQFTPDLTANDILGFQRPNAERTDFEFIPGPIFANIVLADEINRSPGKTQAALLQAMQEGEVSVDRVTYKLDRPFIVLATQNPNEISQATYALPDAQLDRFGVKMELRYPNYEEMLAINMRDTAGTAPEVETLFRAEDAVQIFTRANELARGVQIEKKIIVTVTQLCHSLNPNGDDRYRSKEAKDGTIIRGPSPRGVSTLLRYAQGVAITEGRSYVTFDDINEVLLPVLRHRVEIDPTADPKTYSVDRLIANASATHLKNK